MTSRRAIAEWKPSVCPLCAAGCAVIVRVMEADVETMRNGQAGVVTMAVAKKLEGKPTDPISQGGLCARGQAAIQITYHPDRLTQPLKRTGARGAGEFQPITWDAAIAELVGTARRVGRRRRPEIAGVDARPRASRRTALASAFLTGFGAPAPIEYEFFGDAVLRAGELHQLRPRAAADARPRALADGHRLRRGLPRHLEFAGGAERRVRRGCARAGRQVRGKFVQVESRMSLTGANADEWVPVKPGTEGVLALGLAHVILANKLRPADGGRAGAAIDGWAGGLPDYTPAKVEQITGVAREADRTAGARARRAQPAVAIIGGAPLAQTNGLFQALAVNALNALLGSVEQPGGLFFMPGSLEV